MRKPIDLAIIRANLSYDPMRGEFRWLVSKRGHRKAGDIAGSKTRQGYWRIKIEQIAYLGHRLAWAMHYDCEPPIEIDHQDGNPLNNRIENLREASHLENCGNIKGSGVRFEPDRNKWLARIGVNYRQIHLGRFDTREEAEKVYRTACVKYRGQFARAS